MSIESLEPSGRWWRVNGREIDLGVAEFVGLPRAAVLAYRDGDDEHGRNIAALLEGAVLTGTELDGPAHLAVTGWLFAQSQRIVARCRDRLAYLGDEGVVPDVDAA